MNSYFASVEQQANPFLRGRPVAVCAYLSANGCILASSMEAKKFGIKTGLRVKEAKKLCPEIIIIENHPDKYRSTTEKIFSLLSEYTDKLEPYSIDEAFLELSGLVKNFQVAEKTAREIKARIKKEVGEWLKASQGISFTKFLAKLASDTGPKDSITVIRNISEAEKLYGRLKLTDAWGIGERLKIKLNNLGIFTLKQLKNYPVTNLRTALGLMGYYLWANVNGIEINRIEDGSKTVPKSIGHSYCLPNRTKDKFYLSKILLKLCEKAGRRLREQNLEARSISIYWTYLNGGGWGKNFKTKDGFFTTREIFQKSKAFLRQMLLPDKISMLAVSVGDLFPTSGQLSFLEDKLKKQDLNKALDEINDKFGEFTVIYGQMWETDKNAPDRIGYRKSLKAPVQKNSWEYDKIS